MSDKLGDGDDPGSGDLASGMSLVCAVGRHLCAVPLEHALETMRPLPVEAFPGAPPFIRGVSMIRGKVVPVVDVATLLGEADARPARFVTMAVGGARHVALAVDAVLGLRAIAGDPLQDVPPLLGEMCAETISAIATLDADLLVVLRCTRLVPDDVWAGLDERVPS